MRVNANEDLEEFLWNEVAQRGDQAVEVMLKHEKLGELKYSGHLKQDLANQVWLVDAMTEGGPGETKFKLILMKKDGTFMLNKYVAWVESF